MLVNVTTGSHCWGCNPGPSRCNSFEDQVLSTIDSIHWCQELMGLISSCWCSIFKQVAVTWFKDRASIGKMISIMTTGVTWPISWDNLHCLFKKERQETPHYNPFVWRINPSPPSAPYKCQWIGSALVQMMACCLVSAKPLSEPILGYY